jgi:hypothetical protein
VRLCGSQSLFELLPGSSNYGEALFSLYKFPSGSINTMHESMLSESKSGSVNPGRTTLLPAIPMNVIRLYESQSGSVNPGQVLSIPVRLYQSQSGSMNPYQAK